MSCNSQNSCSPLPVGNMAKLLVRKTIYLEADDSEDGLTREVLGACLFECVNLIGYRLDLLFSKLVNILSTALCNNLSYMMQCPMQANTKRGRISANTKSKQVQ